MKTTVAFYIRNRPGKSQIVLLQVTPVIFNALHVVGAQLFVHNLRSHAESSQGIRAHTVHQHATACPHADHVAFAPAEHILRCFGRSEQKINIFAVLIFRNKQIPKIRMIRQNIIYSGHPDDGADRRMGTDILHPLSETPDFTTVIQTFQILLNCFDHFISPRNFRNML